MRISGKVLISVSLKNLIEYSNIREFGKKRPTTKKKKNPTKKTKTHLTVLPKYIIESTVRSP